MRFFIAVVLLLLLAQVDGQDAPGLGASVQHRQVEGECSILGSDNALCTPPKNAWDGTVEDADVVVDDNDVEEIEEDPMLEEMPGLNFKAYKRADISSFYQESPGSRVETVPDFRGQAAKFQNMLNERLDLYW